MWTHTHTQRHTSLKLTSFSSRDYRPFLHHLLHILRSSSSSLGPLETLPFFMCVFVWLSPGDPRPPGLNYTWPWGEETLSWPKPWVRPNLLSASFSPRSPQDKRFSRAGGQKVESVRAKKRTTGDCQVRSSYSKMKNKISTDDASVQLIMQRTQIWLLHEMQYVWWTSRLQFACCYSTRAIKNERTLSTLYCCKWIFDKLTPPPPVPEQ